MFLLKVSLIQETKLTGMKTKAVPCSEYQTIEELKEKMKVKERNAELDKMKKECRE